ncbi:MAG: hypothetical protein JNM17_08060 [Archangium sp.]|nr:hypothetical protein [Archangium sp.]
MASWRGRLFKLALRGAAWSSRNSWASVVSTPLLSAIGNVLARSRGVQTQHQPQALAETWQRAFPSKREVPIIGVTEREAFAEIHTVCPLRGSGDLAACHRMMAYDRAFVARAGGKFVVLESQATPGVTRCRVSIAPTLSARFRR